jgi:hypothetical protein
MIVAFLRRRPHALTATELARTQRWASYRASNLKFGGLGNRVARAVGYEPIKGWSVLADGHQRAGTRAPQHFVWTLKSDFVTAFSELELSRRATESPRTTIDSTRTASTQPRPAVLDPEVENLLREPLPQPAGVLLPARSTQVTRTIARDNAVRAWVIQQARGICENCKSPAPFLTGDGVPFLEEHHLVRLADGGPDTPENTVALCPNCHRAFHYASNREEIVDQIRRRYPRLKP